REEINNWEDMFRPGVEAFDLLVEVLAAFAADVRSHASTPVIVLLPSQAEVALLAAGGKPPNARLDEALRSRGLTTLDMTEPLAHAARHASPGDVIAGHYKALGNLVVAHTLATRLPPLIAPTCPSSP